MTKRKLPSVALRRDGIAVAERLISLLFRVGVALCALIIAVGWGAGIVLHSRGTPVPGSAVPGLQGSAVVRQLMEGGEVRGEVLPRTALELARGLAAFTPDAVIAAGLVLLIALPILRVTLTVGVFTAQRDWTYVVMTALVLALLISSLFLGKVL